MLESKPTTKVLAQSVLPQEVVATFVAITQSIVQVTFPTTVAIVVASQQFLQEITTIVATSSIANLEVLPTTILVEEFLVEELPNLLTIVVSIELFVLFLLEVTSLSILVMLLTTTVFSPYLPLLFATLETMLVFLIQFQILFQLYYHQVFHLLHYLFLLFQQHQHKFYLHIYEVSFLLV